MVKERGIGLSTATNLKQNDKQVKRKRLLSQIYRDKQLYLLLIPFLLFYILFVFRPMGGMVIAFKDYKPKRGIWGSEWVGFENFKFLFSSNDAGRLVFNIIEIFFITGKIIYILHS